MNIIDAIIILTILFGAVVGLKNGFTKQLVLTLGLLIVIGVSFMLKDLVSGFFYKLLPFFNFGGNLQGVTVVNILIYEVLAFVIVFSILLILFRVILVGTSIFEKVLNMTIILGIPSKILGAIIGAIEYFVITFVVLYILTLPGLNISIVEGSKFKKPILESTPVISQFTKKGVEAVRDFNSIIKQIDENTNPNDINLQGIDLFLNYKIVKIDTVDELILKKKLVIENVESVLKKYR